ncbi:MAG: hypothetical protein HY689_08650 [Chloroflexi bacterium]|nr:hypothetical protein [Chloroflexota bacterium]
MITKQWTLRSIVLRHPHLAKTLADLGIRPAQAYLTVEAVAVQLHKNPEVLVAELVRAADSAP